MKNNTGTITVQCGIQKSVISIEELENGKMTVDCKFMPTLDFTKKPTRDENFVGNVTQMILSALSFNQHIENERIEQ